MRYIEAITPGMVNLGVDAATVVARGGGTVEEEVGAVESAEMAGGGGEPFCIRARTTW